MTEFVPHIVFDMTKFRVRPNIRFRFRADSALRTYHTNSFESSWGREYKSGPKESFETPRETRERQALAAFLTYSRVVLRHRLRHDGVCSDKNIIANDDVSKNLSTGADHYPVTNRGMSLRSGRHLRVSG